MSAPRPVSSLHAAELGRWRRGRYSIRRGTREGVRQGDRFAFRWRCGEKTLDGTRGIRRRNRLRRKCPAGKAVREDVRLLLGDDFAASKRKAREAEQKQEKAARKKRA